ncbi:prepilin-type N-terminal cleavage/methylation domain-containing protein [Francisella sp. 19X1-34]|uniref:prepilin-type N-terminal cleavage/methylation domain-containing protein n=1 Tax=Francisella sp. 19X1-34 TaxID=3087177 RepID=UPI002E31A980|nr:prepilin-type N-terminal cleavage/methylation domain-containing protein [Francisella sp. 19X1-34]MED7788002.1 prepilin-type N-terminal cleavage/methylation domain-containing protein [Francisella sp. 19X1-34]
MVRDNKGFSLVELMVVIAIIAILAAAVVVSYSNHITKVRLQDEIDKMDNYRKAVAVYIQEQGISSDEQFQSGIADIKDNYFGDDNVAIMSEFRENNGRLISHPVVQGTAYQIAITPRINNNGALINWECNIGYDNRTDSTGSIFHATEADGPPSGILPNGCNSSSTDLNDDIESYVNAYNDLSLSTYSEYEDAFDAWMTRKADTMDADSEYQGYITARDNALDDYNNYQNDIATINDEIATRNDLIDQKDTAATQYETEAAAHRANQATAEANGDTELAATYEASAQTAEGNATTLRNEISNLEDEVTLLESNQTTAQTNSINSYNDYTTQASNAQAREDTIEANTKNVTIPDGTAPEDVKNYSYSQAVIDANQRHNESLADLNSDPEYGYIDENLASDRDENYVASAFPDV